MRIVLAALLAGALIGALSVSHAKLPAAPPKSDAERANEAQKAAAAKARDAELLDQAREKAVVNFRQNKGALTDTKKK